MNDPIAQDFLIWAETKARDEVWFLEFRQECIRKLKNFLSRNPEELRRLLKAKLERGSEEHGSPMREEWDIDKELGEEYIDILGWTLVGQYREHVEEKGL